METNNIYGNQSISYSIILYNVLGAYGFLQKLGCFPVVMVSVNVFSNRCIGYG